MRSYWCVISMIEVGVGRLIGGRYQHPTVCLETAGIFGKYMDLPFQKCSYEKFPWKL